MSRVDKKAIRNLERLEIRNTLIFFTYWKCYGIISCLFLKFVIISFLNLRPKCVI